MDDKSPKGICPYYKRETAQLIICTGIVPNSDLESGFASAKAKRNHKKDIAKVSIFDVLTLVC